jgi:hypothetical protein
MTIKLLKSFDLKLYAAIRSSDRYLTKEMCSELKHLRGFL